MYRRYCSLQSLATICNMQLLLFSFLPIGVFLGICMCRPPTQDSLVTWIEYLQDNHPVLKNITVVYDVTVVKDIRDWSDQTRLPFVSATRIEQ